MREFLVSRHVTIQAGRIAIRAKLLDTPTAERIWQALPITSSAKTWGREVYFDTTISSEAEPEAREVVHAGEIAFWPAGDAIAIGFGPTPISKKGEIRMTGRCNVWAMALDDVAQLQSVHAGEVVAVKQCKG
jgi:uncharacterized protein